MKLKYKTLGSVLIVLFSLSFIGCTQSSGAEEEANSKDTIFTLADTDKYYGNTFGQGEIIDVNVEISEEDWQDILDNASAEEYHSANVTVNGTTVENVGFRTKGFSSLTSVENSDSDRYGFKIKTNKYEKGQTLNGLNMFVLNGSYADPSYMREYLTYSANQYLNCITPNVSYTNLYINNELFGFYVMIEAYDDSFVERYTDSEDTVLYKADSENCTLLSSDDGSGFDVQYGEDTDYTNIKKLISVLNSTTEDNKSELEGILDIDSVLKAIAVNTVTGNYDSYNGSKAHNYYLLYSEGKFNYIGWDYNMSFGGFLEDNGSSVTVDVSAPVFGVDISKRPLIEKLLAIPEYYDRYMDYVNSLTSYFADAENKIESIADVISTYVENDPTAFYSIDDFNENITKSDTDLSQVVSNMPGGMNRGDKINPKDGNIPTMPDGVTSASKPENGEGGQGQVPQNNNGQDLPDNIPEPPNGVTPPNGVAPQNGEVPPNRNIPNMNSFGNSMINQKTVSIIDYISQRIENIKSQLNI